MKSKYFLGMWCVITCFILLTFLPSSFAVKEDVVPIIALVIFSGNCLFLCHHLTRYYLYGVPVKRLEHKQSYRVIEQKKVTVSKGGQNRYDFHLKLVNLNDNKTRFYLLESYVPIFDSQGKRLEKFPDAFKLKKTREWKFPLGGWQHRTFYHIIEIPCS
ncbi:MAG: hypothetical protein Q8N56_01295 [bacterium]|nr:hypothetical protein [bacterium]